MKGDGNQQDYGMRIYDTRLGRFLSVDPITKKYPELTPYQFASNSPISGIDLDGLEFYYAANGKYLDHIGTSQQVYTADKIEIKTREATDMSGNKKIEEYKEAINGKSLNINHDQFIRKASTAYAESSVGYGVQSKEEVFAIASINTRNKIAFGVNAPSAINYRKLSDEQHNGTFMQTSKAAVINALSGGFDYSYGGRQWDGAEQAHPDGNSFSNGKFLFKVNVMGWSINDKDYASWKEAVSKKFGSKYFTAPQEKFSVGNYKGYKNAGKIRLESSAQYGLTIFWREVNVSKPTAK